MNFRSAFAFCAALFFAAPNVQAQSDDVPPPPPPTMFYDDIAEVNRKGLVTGPGWSYYGVGFFLLDQEASDPETTASSFSIWGTEHVMDYRLGRVSLALETLGNRNQFNLVQDSISPLSYGQTFDRQRLITYGLGGQLTLRLSLEPSSRLRYERTLEGGGYFVWNYSRRLKSFEDLDPADNSGAPENKLVQKKLAYVNPIEFGVFGRVRINRMYLWGRYRMSDFFQQQDGINGQLQSDGSFSFAKLNELERISVGVGFCINSNN